MKRTITEQVTKEVDFEVPCYRTDNLCRIGKVYSEEKCLMVTYLNGHEAIANQAMQLAFSQRFVDSTEEEFLEKFDEVLSILNK
jgi:hypothetical protein